MKDALKLLAAVAVGAVIALGAVALTQDSVDTQDAEFRVIAEARFEKAVLDVHELYRNLLEQEMPGIEVPSIEGPEPCMGVSAEDLRAACINAVTEPDY